ncbi:hypothetical protein J2X11_002831 [Aeromicrobium panaciterrae]|uniref:Uncharacterized protein n=1 Tax=Aeromicrobium panaciterrae TaxID=363861 RepID=A0ABU1US42_9ACTN|nr:hypothetical protein [Aeromicrobium panaciterrae]MDR7087992.1 hypothetical protein [Aeromicrobium panaciterrae]
MRSTIVRRLGAAISVLALALSLGTVPSSADESPEPFSSKSNVLEDRPNARLATGADLAQAGAARSSGGAAISVTPTVNVTELKAHSAVLNHPDENFIYVDVAVSDPSNIAYLTLSLSVDGEKSGPYEIFFDGEHTFVVVNDAVGLGRAKFYGTKVYYTPETGKLPTWDSTDSNYFYVRRDIYFEATAGYEPFDNTKEFYVEDMGIYSPTIHNFRALSSIKLQYKTGGEWKTKKTITIDDDGFGSYTFTKSTKYYYRIISGKTSTWVGFKKTFPKI